MAVDDTTDPTGWDRFYAWADVDRVRARLDAGAPVNGRLYVPRMTPLHQATSCLHPSGAVVALLLQRGAETEAACTDGTTPLWNAVRHGFGAGVELLLRAGADPWRPIRAGRSAGRIALDGPLADLFAHRADAPPARPADRARQHAADRLIAAYDDLRSYPLTMTDCIGVAFVSGVDEDELIRRLGHRPGTCPRVDRDDYLAAANDSESLDGPKTFWVGSPSDAGVVVIEACGFQPVEDGFCATASADGALLASVFDNPAGGDQTVHAWRNGRAVGHYSPYHEPPVDGPDAVWTYRFGDYATAFGDIPRGLALMAELTGVRPSLRWLDEAPKRLVRPRG